MMRRFLAVISMLSHIFKALSFSFVFQSLFSLPLETWGSLASLGVLLSIYRLLCRIYLGLACIVLNLPYIVVTNPSWFTLPLILQTEKWGFLRGRVICLQPHNVEKRDSDVVGSTGKLALSIFPPCFPSVCCEGGYSGLFHLVQSTGPADLLGVQSSSEVEGRMWWWGIPASFPRKVNIYNQRPTAET